MSDTTGATPELRVLALLGLAQLAIADQLVLLLKRFRAAQLRDLEDALRALPPQVVTHIQAHFDRKLDVKDELERYAQDLLKATHLTRHLQIDGNAQREVLTLVGALGDGDDRALLLKMFQSLGGKLARVLSGFCVQLPHISLQQEAYRVFVATDNGMADLKQWMQWLESVHPSKREIVTEFFIKCTMERCLAQWLKLLNMVDSLVRVTVVDRLAKASAPLVKQIGRFHEVTATPVRKLLDLCEALYAELSLILSEFPMATTLTLYVKFNNDCLIEHVIKALYLVGKGDTIRLIDALATEDDLRAIRVFFIATTKYERRQAILSLYLSLPKLSQSRLVGLTHQAAAPGDDVGGEDPDPSVVFSFVLDGRLKSIDEVLRKLSMVSNDKLGVLLKTLRHYNIAELMMLGGCIEIINDFRCLDAFFRLFQLLHPTQRSMLVDWVHDMPGEEALQLYNKFFDFHTSSQLDKLASLLEMVSSLSKTDKLILCTRLVRPVSTTGEPHTSEQTNDGVLKYLCDADKARRHKIVKLLDATDCSCYDTLLFLLRTQRLPEQEVLTKVMLSLSPSANGRLLTKLQGLDGDMLDEFFQLLMLVPKVEYKMLSRLLVSQEVSLQHFQDFVHVAANMMNQAATREMVIFAAELPPKYRNMFFEMLGQCTPGEKGVIMRILATSTRLTPELLQIFVEILLRMPWETRSTLVEQLKALDEIVHIQTYVLVLQNFDEDACLPRMVHLVSLLPLSARISLVPLFSEIGSIVERVQALTKLDAMRKDQMPQYCSTICDSACRHFIRCSFLRVLGYLKDEYQAGMLRLLLWKSCWAFIEVLAENMIPITSADSYDAIRANGALVNGLAASLTILDNEDDFVLLGDVMEEAMNNDIQLEDLIVVLAHFQERDRLLLFLKYVAHLARFTPSTLFFRVLSRSKATAFLFDMCHVLDLDDALFALRRLDRMWARDAHEVDKMLTAMARNGSVADLRDEFCNAVLGYRERTPMLNTAHHHRIERVVQSHSTLNEYKANVSGDGPHLHPTQVEYVVIDESPFHLSFVAPVPSRPTSVVRQLGQVKDKREEARRRRRCRNWREWTQGDWNDIASIPRPPSTQETAPITCTPEVPEQHLGVSRPTSPSSPDQSLQVLSEIAHTVATSEIATPETQPYELSRLNLPPIVSYNTAVESTSRPQSGLSNRPAATCDQIISSERALARSESAPTIRHKANVKCGPHYRGIQAALGLETDEAYHVPHDKGASIFHSQCKHAIAKGPSRIRVARSEEAIARVLDARADHAIGRRHKVSSPPSKSSLQRTALHTMECATVAIARSQAARSQPASDIVRWVGKNGS